jgi:hypothetical protein
MGYMLLVYRDLLYSELICLVSFWESFPIIKTKNPAFEYRIFIKIYEIYF